MFLSDAVHELNCKSIKFVNCTYICTLNILWSDECCEFAFFALILIFHVTNYIFLERKFNFPSNGVKTANIALIVQKLYSVKFNVSFFY